MIRRLRQRHLRMALLLAVLVPLLLVLGLRARRSLPPQVIPAEFVRP